MVKHCLWLRLSSSDSVRLPDYYTWTYTYIHVCVHTRVSGDGASSLAIVNSCSCLPLAIPSTRCMKRLHSTQLCRVLQYFIIRSLSFIELASTINYPCLFSFQIFLVIPCVYSWCSSSLLSHKRSAWCSRPWHDVALPPCHNNANLVALFSYIKT